MSELAAFLGSLRVDEGVFDLGGKRFPASIRDQVIRTRLSVQHLSEFGFLDTSRTLCVVGARKCGVDKLSMDEIDAEISAARQASRA